MVPIDKIMVGCDFSKYAKEALKYAASLADKCQAELLVVNVINPKTIDTLHLVADRTFDRTVERNVDKLADDFADREVKDRLKKMEKLIEEISAAHLSIKKIARVGVPFKALNSIAQAEAADLLVVGIKGRGNLTDILFGSNAEKLFRHCTVPLLSVPLHKNE